MANPSAHPTATGMPADHFVQCDGAEFAGHHLIVDLWGASRIDDVAHIEATLRECAAVCGATVLHVFAHCFESGGGVSGVAVLAESHISVHSWPERGYAAFDIFMCGRTRPELALAVLQRAFAPERLVVGRHRRGLPPGSGQV